MSWPLSRKLDYFENFVKDKDLIQVTSLALVFWMARGLLVTWLGISIDWLQEMFRELELK